MIDVYATYTLCDYISGETLEVGEDIDYLKYLNVDGEPCFIEYVRIEDIDDRYVTISTAEDEEYEIAVKDIIGWE